LFRAVQPVAQVACPQSRRSARLFQVVELVIKGNNIAILAC
jgi:hypothetical protein